MDITKELKEIELSEKHAEKILANIFAKKENLRKKEYLNRVIYIVNEIDKAIKSNFFHDNRAFYLQSAVQQEYNGEYQLYFMQLNSDKEHINEFANLKTGDFTPTKKFLLNLCEYIGSIQSDFCNKQMQQNSPILFELKDDSKEIFFKFLLSEELYNLDDKNNIDNNDISKKVQDIVSQIEELKDKEHILEIVSLANKLENLVKDKFFKELGVEAIEITCDYDYEDGYRIIPGTVLTNNGFTEDANESQREFFEEFFSYITELDSNFISEELISSAVLKLNQNVAEQVINLFLSPRLKTILDYNIMQSDLTDNSENNFKKLKI